MLAGCCSSDVCVCVCVCVVFCVPSLWCGGSKTTLQTHENVGAEGKTKLQTQVGKTMLAHARTRTHVWDKPRVRLASRGHANAQRGGAGWDGMATSCQSRECALKP